MISENNNPQNYEGIIAADIGNSRIKLFDGTESVSFKNGMRSDLEILNYISNRNQRRVVYSSVNTYSKNKFLDILKRSGYEFADVESLLEINSPIDFSEVKGMGSDRKLGLVSALRLVAPPLITIDFGTCITVNIVDEKCKCLGGIIIPGFNTEARALEHFTSSLPRVQLDYTFNNYGKDTVSAINAGIQNITFKGLDAHLQTLCKELFADKKVNIIMTGGISEILSQFPFSFEYKIVKNLVIEGIFSIAKDFLSANKAL